MTRKHFIEVADALKSAKPDASTFHNADDAAHALRIWRALVLDMAMVCRRTNPNFNEGRFTAACGL